MSSIFVPLFVVLFHVFGCDGGTFCYEYLTYSYSYNQAYYTYYAYCEDGCCGYTLYRSCCSSNDSTGLIVGIVVGCLVFVIGVVVIFIICILKKKQKLQLESEHEIEMTPSEYNSEIMLGPTYGDNGSWAYPPPPNGNGFANGGPRDCVTGGQDNPVMTVEVCVSPPPPYSCEEKSDEKY